MIYRYKDLSLKYRIFFRLPYFFYNKLTAPLYGKKLIQITTIGRVSKKERKTLLEVIGQGFGENSDWVLNLKKNPQAKVVWANHNYTSDVEWLDQKSASHLLTKYKKHNPKLVKFYESLFKRSWDEFSELPVCMLSSIK